MPVHVFEVKVTDSMLDDNGHVNNVEYVRWMQSAAISHSDAVGCTEATQADGASWFVRSHHIEYLRPAQFGDTVAIRTWVEDVKRASSARRYEMFRNDELLARGSTDWVYVDGGSGRPRSIPEPIRTMFE